MQVLGSNSYVLLRRDIAPGSAGDFLAVAHALRQKVMLDLLWLIFVTIGTAGLYTYGCMQKSRRWTEIKKQVGDLEAGSYVNFSAMKQSAGKGDQRAVKILDQLEDNEEEKPVSEGLTVILQEPLSGAEEEESLSDSENESLLRLEPNPDFSSDSSIDLDCPPLILPAASQVYEEEETAVSFKEKPVTSEDYTDEEEAHHVSPRPVISRRLRELL